MIAWNGYYISEHMFKYSPREWIRTLCYSVKRCVHGVNCKKCCHFFTKPELLDNGSLVRRDPSFPQAWLDRVFIHNYFWEMQHGPQQIRPRHVKIFARCAEKLCMNLNHLYRGMRGTEADFWSNVRMCEHGRTCTECCWDWQGRTIKEALVKYGRPIGIYAIRRYDRKLPVNIYAHRLAYFFVHGQYIDRLVASYHHCGSTGLCCNVHHLRFIPSTKVLQEARLTYTQQRILQKKLYLEIAA